MAMLAGEMSLSPRKARNDASFVGDELTDSLMFQGFSHIEDLLKMEFSNEEPRPAKCNDLLATAMYQHILTDGATEPDEPVNQLPPWSPLTPESQTFSEASSEDQDGGTTDTRSPGQTLQGTDDLLCSLDDHVPETLQRAPYPVIEPVSAPPSPVVVIRSQNICSGCDGCITDRYILQVNGLLWHETCLRCCECHLQLGYHGKCYFKDGRIYCKQHYQEIYGVRCTKCARVVARSDLVHHVGRHVYHVTCFACTPCGRLLSTGEHFSVQGSDLICCDHVDRSSSWGLTSLTGSRTTKRSAVDDPGSPKKPKSKRLRTQFTEEQVQILTEEFKQETNPVGSDLEQISLKVGLSRRVTQIWFQNTRARNRKQQS